MTTGRSLTAQTAANLVANHVTSFPMVEMDLLSGMLRCCGCAFNVVWGGNTYLGTYGIGTVDTIQETDAEVRGLSFTLSGVSSDRISLAMSENVAMRPVTLRIATLAGGTLSVDENAWQGYLDTMTLVDQGDTCTVRVTAEHRMISWRNPKLVNFSAEDHSLVSSSDKFYQYIAAVAAKPIVWPTAKFFER